MLDEGLIKRTNIRLTGERGAGLEKKKRSREPSFSIAFAPSLPLPFYFVLFSVLSVTQSFVSSLIYNQNLLQIIKIEK